MLHAKGKLGSRCQRLQCERWDGEVKLAVTVRIETKLKVQIKASVHKRVRGRLKAGSRKKICAWYLKGTRICEKDVMFYAEEGCLEPGNGMPARPADS